MVLPAREVADTIGAIVERLRGLDPLIDQVLVVDAASARRHAPRSPPRAGAEVHQEAELLPEFGPVLGKGDAMWRALVGGRAASWSSTSTRTRATSRRTSRLGMLGPLICEPDVRFVKGFFRRPYAARGRGGAAGRRRPGHRAHRAAAPVGVLPRAGRLRPAARRRGGGAPRRCSSSIPFATGYAVETAMLLHARDVLGGTDAMAQVDLDVRLQPPPAAPRPRPDGVRGAAA